MAAGLAVGGLFLWLALRDLAPGQALAAVRDAGAAGVLATGLAGVGFMLFKALRWSLLLRRVVVPTPRLIHAALYIGSAANLVVAHSGEVLRATLLARRTGASASAVLATVAVERVFDFVALAMISALAVALDPRVSRTLSLASGIAFLVVVAAVVIAWLMLRANPWVVRPMRAVLAHLPVRLADAILAQWRRGRVGLESLVDPAFALRAIGWSLLQWACVVAAIATSGWAVGVSMPLSAAVAVFAMMVIGLLLPAAPAQLGTTQIAFVGGLALVGVPTGPAIAASLIYTGLVVVPVMLAGALIAALTDWQGGSSRGP